MEYPILLKVEQDEAQDMIAEVRDSLQEVRDDAESITIGGRGGNAQLTQMNNQVAQLNRESGVFAKVFGGAFAGLPVAKRPYHQLQ